MSGIRHTYLALGDSMSIDEYTDVQGGGAASQFSRMLGSDWVLDDRTCDGSRMQDVPIDARGDVVTLTIGGNDLLWNRQDYLRHGLSGFAAEHLELLRAIRAVNRQGVFIVGDIYQPDAKLSKPEQELLSTANRIIHSNCYEVEAQIARIFDAFHGHEREFLCFQIEPTLAGATAIARLFDEGYKAVAEGGA